jgi:hypothetical protein
MGKDVTTDASMAEQWADARERGVLTERQREFDEYARGDAGFAVWLFLVDRRIGRAFGIGLFDLADWGARSAFDAGVTPRDAARDALENDDIGALMLAMTGE